MIVPELEGKVAAVFAIRTISHCALTPVLTQGEVTLLTHIKDAFRNALKSGDSLHFLWRCVNTNVRVRSSS